jgi:serine/threonine protein kinase
MQGCAADLPATDVFALGMSLYELAVGAPLPRGGREYHVLRERLPRPSTGALAAGAGAGGGGGGSSGGGGDDAAAASDALYELLVAMTSPDPSQRPTAEAILAHPLLAGGGGSGASASASAELARLRAELAE